MPHPSSPLLSAERLGLTLPDGRRLFDDLDLSFGEERTGLIGANGVGKSLLLDVLVGVRPPDAGTLVARGRIAYVRQGGGRAAGRSRETVAERLGVRHRLDALARVLAGGTDPSDFDRIGPDGWSLAERVQAELARWDLGHLPLERSMSAVSGGEATRVTLVGALLQAPDFLVLDEPTNDLDASSRHALLDSLGAWNGGLLVVSHDREVLRRVDRIIELTPSGAREYGGNYDAYRSIRDAEAAAAETELAEAEAARKRATADARKVHDRQAHRAARGRKSRREGGVPKILLNARRNASEGTAARLARTMVAVQDAAARRVEEAKERVDELARLRMDVAPSGLPNSKDVLVLEDVAYTPPGAEAPLFEGIDLVMRGPERVALAGPNGSGKTTLLQLAMGELVPDRGTVHLGVPRPSVAYLDQAVRLLPSLGTVLEAFTAVHAQWDEGHARHVLARYLFPGDAALAPINRLSGGERMRAGLACVLGGAAGPSLLVLDEPTNHLDFRSLEVVERAVAAYDGALLIVSHDPDFLAAARVERQIELGGPPSTR